MQKKTERPVQFEITEQTRFAITAWITAAHLKPEQFLFPSRVSESPHLSTRQYSRIVGSWYLGIEIDDAWRSPSGPRSSLVVPVVTAGSTVAYRPRAGRHGFSRSRRPQSDCGGQQRQTWHQ